MTESGDQWLLLDACVTINLAATGVPLYEYSEDLGVRFAMTEMAVGEALYLPDEFGGSNDRFDVVEIRDLATEGGLSVLELSADELESFVTYALQVDDGEASTLAVAAHRRIPVATDDRKAHRLARTVDPPIEIVSTTELLRRWSASEAAGVATLPEVIRRIEQRASFVPRRDDPNLEWWVQSRLD